MGEKTEIAWCDATFNPWIGCTKVSPGCDHCYAERDFDLRKHVARWGAGNPRHRTSFANWNNPRRWQRQAEKFRAEHGRRRRVFCASLADVFDNEIDPQWRRALFKLIAETPDLDWLLLTKRIGNVRGMVPLPWVSRPFQHGPDPTNIYPAGWPDNVWLGATIVNQEEADRDIPKLLAIPAAVRWISAEPLLGPVDFVLRGSQIAGWDEDWKYSTLTGEEWASPRDDGPPSSPKLEWIVAGGESGPGARRMHPDWPRAIRDQCAAAGVPFFFKQMTDRRGCRIPWESVPEDLQIREHPTPRTAP